MRRKPRSLLLGLPLLVLVGTACSSAEEVSGAGGDGAEDSYTYGSDAEDVTQIEGVHLAGELGALDVGEEYRVAVVLKSLTNQYWQGIEEGARAAAEDFGVDVTVQAASSESAHTEQLTIAQTMVGQRYDAYVIAPESTSNLAPAINQMRGQRAPVVNVDDARVPATVFVGPDHELDGRQAAELFAELLPEGGQVAQIEGQAGSSAATLRIQGFEAGVAEHDGLELVASAPGDWDADKSYAATQTILRQYPEVRAIYANNDTMAVGVARAVQQAGADVAVVGTDGVPEAVDGVRDGTVTATVSPLPYYEGYWAVEAAVRLLEGQDVPQWVVAPAQLITTDNVDEFYDENGRVRTDLYE